MSIQESAVLHGVREFNALFCGAKLWDYPAGKGPQACDKTPEKGIRVSSYCIVNRREDGGSTRWCSLCVKASPLTLAALDRHMLRLDGDELYFEVFVDGDTATVRAYYNKILGSRVLAVVRTDSLPAILDGVRA